MKEDAARPRVDAVRGWESCETWGDQPACIRRPARVEAAARLCVSRAAGMLNRPGRKTHSDRLGEDEAQKALHPQSPAGEAINHSRQTSVQREKRSTPTTGRCPTSEGPTSNSNRRTWTEDEGPTSNSVVSARAACGELRQIRSGSSSLVGDLPESESSVRSDPGNKDRAPRFLWSETLVESQTVQTLLPHQRPDVKAFGQSAPTSFTKLHGSSPEAGAATRRPISTRLRRSACAEAHAFSALSACRRALSSAS